MWLWLIKPYFKGWYLHWWWWYIPRLQIVIATKQKMQFLFFICHQTQLEKIIWLFLYVLFFLFFFITLVLVTCSYKILEGPGKQCNYICHREIYEGRIGLCYVVFKFYNNVICFGCAPYSQVQVLVLHWGDFSLSPDWFLYHIRFVLEVRCQRASMIFF